MTTLPTPARRAGRVVRDGLLRRGVLVERLSEPDRRFLTALVDDTVPLPDGTAEALRADHPRLIELHDLYAGADPAVRTHSRWSAERLDPWLDLTRFRGDNAYIWHYREGRRVSELKYLVWAQDVRHRDPEGLLDRLGEDGAFGCWTYDFDGLPRLSRDLLDSVGELLFLDAHLGVLSGAVPRVLDIGAGYGRLAHRYVTACPDTADYACTDAIATSTFVCEHYLRHRGLEPVARAVPLTAVADLAPGSFDLACNIHSWSECPLDAIAWWLDQLARLEVPHLFVVPNEPEGFASLEADGRQLDYLPVIEAAGYRLVRDEPVFADPAVRAALGVADRHTLFRRTS
ncbi:MAG TPA: putative sugar O-methyltransferase [Iamia sp.]|nr:putative sugar O-methyltransferase [Iamia sp.]